MIAALIPAGGKSRRMGFAKLLLEVKGKSLLAGTVEVAASVSEAVLVVVGRLRRMPTPRWPRPPGPKWF